MNIWAIILFAFIYVAAIVCCILKSRLPRRYELFGKQYGQSFKVLDKNMKIKKIVVYALLVLFSLAHLILPVYTLFNRWTRIDSVVLFVIAYIVTTIVWVLLVIQNGGGKRYYVDQIKAILEDTPLYVATRNLINECPEYKVILPCVDGVAFFVNELPKKLEDEYIPIDWVKENEFSYSSFNDMADDWAEKWEKKEQNRWLRVDHNFCDTKLVGEDFGYKTLSEDDMEEMLKYLSEDESLNVKQKKHIISKTFMVDYVVTKTTERTVGFHTSTEVKNSDKTAYGVVNISLGILVRTNKAKK